MGKDVLHHPEVRQVISKKPTHQHRKSGDYQEIRRSLLEADLTPAVVYRAKDDAIWVRPAKEFDDGRFTRL